MPFPIFAGENIELQCPLFTLASNLNWRGVYSNTTAYVVNDAVLGPDNNGYSCILATTGNAPPNATYWSALPLVAAETIRQVLIQLIGANNTQIASWLYQWVALPLAGPTAQTSGTLVAGNTYKITTFVTGDDFSNLGGTNVTGNVFVATGTTPTNWTHASTLIQVLVTKGNQYIISTFVSGDNFTNIGAGSNVQGNIFTAIDVVPTTWTHGSILQQVSFPTTGNAMSVAPGLVNAEISGDTTRPLDGIFEVRFALSVTDSIYVGSGAQTDVLCLPNAIQVLPC